MVNGVFTTATHYSATCGRKGAVASDCGATGFRLVAERGAAAPRRRKLLLANAPPGALISTCWRFKDSGSAAFGHPATRERRPRPGIPQKGGSGRRSVLPMPTSKDDRKAFTVVRPFVEDIAGRRTYRWRLALPSHARIESHVRNEERGPIAPARAGASRLAPARAPI
jgi:hypothetical protein